MNKTEYNQSYYTKNKEAIKSRQKQWYLNNREHVLSKGKSPGVRARANELRKQPHRQVKDARTRKVWHFKTKYGMTDLDVIDMLWEQDNKCLACGTDAPGGKKGWHVDHCHKTNMVRGILCMRCNLVLGHVKDDPVVLQKLITYLHNTLDKRAFSI